MKNQDYHSTISTHASPGDVFDKIRRVSEWWTSNFEGRADQTHDVFTIRFGKTFATFEIIESLPGKKMVWEVLDSNLDWLKDQKEWNGTKINWELSGRDRATDISFTHLGLVPENECFENCRRGWDFYIRESLFKLINEGKGLPDTPQNAR